MEIKAKPPTGIESKISENYNSQNANIHSQIPSTKPQPLFSARDLCRYSGTAVGGISFPIIYLANHESVNQAMLPPAQGREIYHNIDNIFPSIGIGTGLAIFGALVGAALGSLLYKTTQKLKNRLV